MMERRPLMLKDYLRDDLSSCSSNGFKSLPRRQCCATVRYLLEIDFKARDSTNKNKLHRSRSKATSSTISAWQKASEAVIKAVKHIPFPSIKSPSLSAQKRGKKGILPRSLSRKLLRGSFWRKAEKHETKIERWKTFLDLLLDKKQKPSDQNTYRRATTTTSSTTSTSTTTSDTNSWSDSEFTSDFVQCSGGNTECSGENEAVESKKLLPEKKFSDGVGGPVGDDSVDATTTTTSPVENAKKGWPHEEEKEQFSPVSVLDFPFHDEKENCSPFQRSLARKEGTRQKVVQKIRRFESLAQLDPVDLDKRIALSEFDEESHHASLLLPCSKSMHNNNVFSHKEEENFTEQKARELLKLIKATIPLDSIKFKADKMLLDFFKERVSEKYVSNNAISRGDECRYELLKVAGGWITGQHPELLYKEWEVHDSRKAYIKDMEEGGRRRKLEEEKEEVASEVEAVVLNSLVNELFLDLILQ